MTDIPFPKTSLFRNMTGMKIGRLTVVSFAGCLPIKKDGRTGSCWNCLCDCGKACVVPGGALTQTPARKPTVSCGCFSRETTSRLGKSRIKHGAARTNGTTTEYHIWNGMKNRCNNPKDKQYSNYGGRGISVCPRWNESFEAFLEDMGHRPSKLSLDRIDVNGHYCKENCRWASTVQQARNRRDTIMVEYNGATRSLADLSDELGLPYNTIRGRYRIGLRQETGLFAPSRTQKYTFDGRTMSLTEWSFSLGIKRITLEKRLKSGWSVEDAFSIPVDISRRVGNSQ